LAGQGGVGMRSEVGRENGHHKDRSEGGEESCGGVVRGAGEGANHPSQYASRGIKKKCKQSTVVEILGLEGGKELEKGKKVEGRGKRKRQRQAVMKRKV